MKHGGSFDYDIDLVGSFDRWSGVIREMGMAGNRAARRASAKAAERVAEAERNRSTRNMSQVTSESQEGKWQRAKRLFSRPKLPAWVAVVILLFNFIPDFKSRIDFWLEAARSGGTYMNVVVAVVSSWYFNAGLLILAIIWFIFVGEPIKGVRRHPVWSFIGSALATTFLALFLITVAYGYYQVAVEEAANRMLHAERHVTPELLARIQKEVGPIRGIFKQPIKFTALVDPEVSGFASELMAALISLNIPVASAGPRGPIPFPLQLIGVRHGNFYQAFDCSHPPPEVKALADSFERAGLRFFCWRNVDLSDTDFIVSIGLP